MTPSHPAPWLFEGRPPSSRARPPAADVQCSIARRTKIACCIALSVVGLACSPAQKRPVVATALDDPEMRRESFEATLRVLDANPQYVDELFQKTLAHPKTLDRLLQNTARQLRDEKLARHAARHLTAHPESLKMTLIASLDEMADQPDAMNATAAAIEERSDITARAMVQRETAVRRALRALLQEVQRNPKAEEYFLTALRENSQTMAAVLTKHPDEMGVLFTAIGKSGVRRGSNEFQAFLSEFSE